MCGIVLLLIQIEKMSEAFQDNFPKLLPIFPLRQKKLKVLFSLAYLKRLPAQLILLSSYLFHVEAKTEPIWLQFKASKRILAPGYLK